MLPSVMSKSCMFPHDVSTPTSSPKAFHRWSSRSFRPFSTSLATTIRTPIGCVQAAGFSQAALQPSSRPCCPSGRTAPRPRRPSPATPPLRRLFASSAWPSQRASSSPWRKSRPTVTLPSKTPTKQRTRPPLLPKERDASAERARDAL